MKDTSHYSKIQDFVDALQEEDLVPLYNQIGHRLNIMQKARELYALKEFHLLDRVYFHHGTEHIEGTVSRINMRTVSVITDDQRRWTVSPGSLKKISPEQNQMDAKVLARRHRNPVGNHQTNPHSSKRTKKRKK